MGQEPTQPPWQSLGGPAYQRAAQRSSHRRPSRSPSPTCSFGCGAVWGTLWLQGVWPPEWNTVSIMVKELVPVVLASALWGKHWAGQLMHFHIDNISVVATLGKGSSKEPSGIVMHFHFHYKAYHIPGSLNVFADQISRHQHPTSPLLQTPIPPMWDGSLRCICSTLTIELYFNCCIMFNSYCKQ